MRWFRKTVALEDQLDQLAGLGITLNAGVQESDLLTFHTRDELERTPFKLLAETMGIEIQREPWTPVANRIWSCDFEQIEGPGSYTSVVERLEALTDRALMLTNIEDDLVQFEEGQPDQAWVQFKHGNETERWELRVDSDRLDPEILQKFDALLAKAGNGVRIFGNFKSYGQAAFLAGFTLEQQRRFTKLSGIKMEAVN